MLKITAFKKENIEEAQKIALACYNNERAIVTALPEMNTVPDLAFFAENDKGICAFEDGKLAGYLCAWGPFDNAFACNPGTKGVWSPAHANGAASGEHKVHIYRAMYQEMAKKWVAGGALIHPITLYAHDKSAIEAFFTYGFGMRCIDAVKFIEPREATQYRNITFAELTMNDAGRIAELNNLLIEHLAESPCFLNYPGHTKNADIILKEADEDGIRYFAAKEQNNIIAYIKIDDSSEHFATHANDMMNICGAFLLPEYRGRGIFDELLFYTESVLAGEGYMRLGVDFESFNPSAYGFWLKYFTAYTYSVVRRIDERIQ